MTLTNRLAPQLSATVFKPSSLRAFVGPVEQAVRRSAKTDGETDNEQLRVISSVLLEAFRSGVDGCYLVRSLGRLSAAEQEVATAYFSDAADMLMDEANEEAAHKAMNALWSVEPTSARRGFFKKMAEYRFLSLPGIRRFLEAADKVQYAARAGDEWDKSDESIRQSDSTAITDTAERLLRNQQLQTEVKSALENLAGSDAPPKLNFEISMPGGEEVYHLAQVHRYSSETLPSPRGIAYIVAIQKGILDELIRLRPTYLINEGVPRNIHRSLIVAANRGFHSIPKGLGQLSSTQMALLYAAGAGVIYWCLDETVIARAELSDKETAYMNRLSERSSAAKQKRMQSDVTNSSGFLASLAASEPAEWDHARFINGYREEAVAELIAEQLRRSPKARIAVVFGSAHDFRAALERVKKRTRAFSLMRMDWEPNFGEGVNPYMSDEEQTKVVSGYSSIGVGNIELYTGPIASQIAVLKLRPTGNHTIRETLAEARLAYRVWWAERPDLVAQMNHWLDERLRTAGASTTIH